MPNDQFSKTAISAACYRAYHFLHDDPKIFSDPCAADLVGELEYSNFRVQMIAGFKNAAPDFAASFDSDEALLAFMMQAMAAPALTLSRARYAEDILETLLSQGIKQYIILGAGLDSFAFRSDLTTPIEVFELDHPDTQAYKRDRLAHLGWKMPAKLHFIPVDFNTQSVESVLSESAYDSMQPGFFSWLGVTYYLPRASFLNTLGSIVKIAALGSHLVFDYLDILAFDPARANQRIQAMLLMAGGVGESINLGLDPDTLAKELDPIGFSLHENLGAEDIQTRYFRSRHDQYHACEHAHFAWARVKG